jgi:hypothetical protein
MISTAKYFNREGDEIDERSALDRHGIMRDGIAMRVPLQMRDASRLTIDASLHRPGFRVGDTDVRDARQQANDEYLHDLTNAWKSQESKVSGFGSTEFRSAQQEGAVCTINGFPGHINSKGECIADPPDQPERLPVKLDANAHRSRMAQTYDAYDRELTNAWRMR